MIVDINKSIYFCKCGCGEQVTKAQKYPYFWNDFVQYHASKTRIVEPKSKIAPLCGCGCGKQVKKHRGKWNKYLYNHQNIGKRKVPPVDVDKAPLCACGCGEKVKWNSAEKKWRKFIQYHAAKFKKRKLDYDNPPLCACGCGLPVKANDKNKWNKYFYQHQHIGRKLSKEWKNKLKKSLSRENNPRWKGGISFEPYCPIWEDKEFKQDIKDRDNNVCQNPDCWHTSNRLCGHHINYDKTDCNPKNIITVCISCNSRANKNREWHTKFYQNIMSEKYGYEYSE